MAETKDLGRYFFELKDPTRSNQIGNCVLMGSKYIKEYLLISPNYAIINFYDVEVKENEQAFKEIRKFYTLPSGIWCSHFTEFDTDKTPSNKFLNNYTLSNWVITASKVNRKPITAKTCYVTVSSDGSYDVFDCIPVKRKQIYNNQTYEFWVPSEGGIKLLSNVNIHLFKDKIPLCQALTINSDPLQMELEISFK